MAKFSRNRWSSDFSDRKFTSDQMERFMDGLRDDLHGRHDFAPRNGKTIHSHKPFGEAPREFTSDEMLATLVSAARNGDTQSQFRAGLEYARRGNMLSAKNWLKKAADRNWPGAKEKFAELFGADRTHVKASTPVEPQGTRCVDDAKKPCVRQCKVFSLPFSPGKFFVSAKVDGFPHWYHMGLVAVAYGLTMPLMYDTYTAAELDAKRLMETMLRGGAGHGNS